VWFEVKYFSNELSWEPYSAIHHLSALQYYFQELDIEKISPLPSGSGSLQLQTVSLGGATGSQTGIVTCLACFAMKGVSQQSRMQTSLIVVPESEQVSRMMKGLSPSS